MEYKSKQNDFGLTKARQPWPNCCSKDLPLQSGQNRIELQDVGEEMSALKRKKRGRVALLHPV